MPYLQLHKYIHFYVPIQVTRTTLTAEYRLLYYQEPVIFIPWH